jgi:hypothetical protein
MSSLMTPHFIVHWDHFVLQQAEQWSPLFHFALSQGPYREVQCIAIGIKFLPTYLADKCRHTERLCSLCVEIRVARLTTLYSQSFLSNTVHCEQWYCGVYPVTCLTSKIVQVWATILCLLSCHWTGRLESSSRLHTVRVTGILNICCHIITIDW